MSKIPPDLRAAYQATHYVIQRPDGDLIVQIGQQNPELAAFQTQQDAYSGAYLTAWNPYSQIATSEDNVAANSFLEAELAQAGLKYLSCLGKDPTGQWTAEPGFWIFNADRRWLQRVGRRFRQNAVVFSGPANVPRLLCLR